MNMLSKVIRVQILSDNIDNFLHNLLLFTCRFKTNNQKQSKILWEKYLAMTPEDEMFIFRKKKCFK